MTIMRKYLAVFTVALALLAGTAQANNGNVVRDSNYNLIKNSFDNCVRTRWDAGWDLCDTYIKPVSPVAKISETEAAPIQSSAIARKPIKRSRSYLVFFDFDSSALTEGAVEIIKKANSEASKNSGDLNFSLTGHADRSGSDKYNMKLSKRRVNSVKNELIKSGSDDKKIETFAKGESDPLVPTADGVKEPQNRRVEIIYSVEE